MNLCSYCRQSSKRLIRKSDERQETEVSTNRIFFYAVASINNIDLTKAIMEKDKKAAITYNQAPNLAAFLEARL